MWGLTLTRPDAKMLVSCGKFKLYQKTVKNGHLVKNPPELAEELRQWVEDSRIELCTHSRIFNTIQCDAIFKRTTAHKVLQCVMCALYSFCWCAVVCWRCSGAHNYQLSGRACSARGSNVSLITALPTSYCPPPCNVYFFKLQSELFLMAKCVFVNFKCLW